MGRRGVHAIISQSKVWGEGQTFYAEKVYDGFESLNGNQLICALEEFNESLDADLNL